MSVKRFDGTNWIDVASVKRFDGLNWIDAASVKRFDGTNWVETRQQNKMKFIQYNNNDGQTNFSITDNGNTLNYFVKGITSPPDTNNIWFAATGNFGNSFKMTFHAVQNLSSQAAGHILVMVQDGTRAGSSPSDAYWYHDANRDFTIRYTHSTAITTIYFLLGAWDTCTNTGTISNLKINDIPYIFSAN